MNADLVLEADALPAKSYWGRVQAPDVFTSSLLSIVILDHQLVKGICNLREGCSPTRLSCPAALHQTDPFTGAVSWPPWSQSAIHHPLHTVDLAVGWTRRL